MNGPEFEDGKYVGVFDLNIRNLYIKYRVARYLWDHPQASVATANKHAKVAWRRKASQGRRR